jgi:hypothetical protein
MTSPTTLRAGRAGILILSLGLVFAACSSGAAPATSSPSGSPPAASGSPSASGAGSEPGNIGSLPPDTPVGGGADPGAGGGGQPPAAGQPQVVRPQPGTIDPREVGIGTLLAQVESRQVLVNARWWSGVEPCYVLDRVAVSRAGNTFTVALFEGAGQADAMCIEIAVEKVTAIDLGELEPGTYTIEASSGDAEPITVEVS